MVYAVEASASTAMPKEKRQLRVKHQQQEGPEPNKRLSEIEKGECSRMPENNPPTGTLEHRTSHSTDHLVLRGRHTREEGTGRGAPRRRRPSKGARNEKTMLYFFPAMPD